MGNRLSDIESPLTGHQPHIRSYNIIYLRIAFYQIIGACRCLPRQQLRSEYFTGILCFN